MKIYFFQKRFIVPSTADQAKIPFGRVNHNKYMVTDRTAYIGTSNWSGDYFINTAGIGLVMQDDEEVDDHHDPDDTTSSTMNNNDTSTTTEGSTRSRTTIRSDLAETFDRDWNSMYALDLIR